MKNQKYRQWCNRKALLAGVLAVSMAVTPMTTAFAGTGTQTAIALQDAKETSDEVVLADFDFNEAGNDGSFSGGNAIATVGGGSIELVDHDGGKAAKFVASDKDWLQVRAADGSSLLKGHDEVTISYDILPEMSNSHWVFYAAENGNSLNWNDNGNKVVAHRAANGLRRYPFPRFFRELSRNIAVRGGLSIGNGAQNFPHAQTERRSGRRERRRKIGDFFRKVKLQP